MPELEVSPAGRRYGAKKSPFDHRDFGVASVPDLVKTLPPKIDLSAWCGPVRDQENLGACTAFAGSAMREFLLRRYQSNNQIVLSPLFLYWEERWLDGDLSEGDTGSTGRTCVRAMNQFGICPEPDDPYDISVFQTPPSPADVQAASQYKAGAYHAITNVSDMKTCLASSYGFIVGFSVYSSFESDQTAKDGLMPVPNLGTESLLGGHEVFFCGYDDTIVCPGAKAGAFKVQNSWGSGWGENGFFWFPYQCAADPNVLMDAFIQHLGRPWISNKSVEERAA